MDILCDFIAIFSLKKFGKFEKMYFFFKIEAWSKTLTTSKA